MVKKKWITCISLFTLLFCFSSCQQVNESIEMSESDAIARAEQTLWQLIDDSGDTLEYLSEEDNDVIEIMQLIQQHTNIVDNRTVQSLRHDEEMVLYSDSFSAALLQNGYNDAIDEMYMTNQIEISKDGLVWYVSYFNLDKTTCKVTIDSCFILNECSTDYLEQMQMSIGESYVEKRLYYCEKTENGWKISNITKSSLTKKSGIN